MASRKSNPFKDDKAVTPAFKSGGVQYYTVKDVFDTYAFRGLDALDVYEQWGMRCSHEYLKAHTEAVKNIAQKKSLTTSDVMEVFQLNHNLSERLSLAVPTADLIYKFASVVYFDETESPYKYDPEYGKVKIERWKKDMKVDVFFSLKHIKELLPSPKLSEQDLTTYSKVANKISLHHLERVFSNLSQGAQNKDFYKALLYQKSLQQMSAV